MWTFAVSPHIPPKRPLRLLTFLFVLPPPFPFSFFFLTAGAESLSFLPSDQTLTTSQDTCSGYNVASLLFCFSPQAWKAPPLFFAPGAVVISDYRVLVRSSLKVLL